MALDFIKKVFSFGKGKPAAASGTEAARASETVAEGLAEPKIASLPPLPRSAGDSVVSGFPADSAMEFTPETAPEPDLSTPEPADEEHAGEPPIAAPADAPGNPERLPGAEIVPADLVTPAQGAPGTGAIEPEVASEAGHAEAGEIMPVMPHGLPDAGEPATAEAAQDRAGLTAPAGLQEIEVSPVPEPAALEGPETPSGTVQVGKTVSRAAPLATPAAEPQTQAGWWQKLRQGLSRSSSQLTGQVTSIFTKRKLDDDTLQDLEDVLIQADLGVETAMRITGALSASRYGRDISAAEVNRVMAAEIEKVLSPVAKPLQLDLSHRPHVILVVGVNGTGKTTTIGKLSAKLSAGGLKVMLAAGDTFRAAAIEQLKIWGERTGAQVISTRLGADAAGLAYEAFEAARTAKADVLIIDTAGRLQNRTELMDELAKVVRVIGKLDPEAPHTVLQTLDATTGQNALNQVEIFRNIAGVNGLVMTKLDGTARGGILVAIAAKHKLPVYFIGVGEGVDDLEPFEAKDFAAAIAGETE
ncbi:signal recognition particle-docking protein FtsY [Hoeflea marina]|uniref:Signal recognition particle receptor FtsY n=1 Tax=Hoeflea marina TaxID=274592 RepID=A0A317PKM7_9HYPH|nr:signal recognition particle-docking protein FtsY [Hoeflea marina]PWV98297.1 signal recognition particle-docking protein FtsY [Hoeflea marina]